MCEGLPGIPGNPFPPIDTQELMFHKNDFYSFSCPTFINIVHVCYNECIFPDQVGVVGQVCLKMAVVWTFTDDLLRSRISR